MTTIFRTVRVRYGIRVKLITPRKVRRFGWFVR